MFKKIINSSVNVGIFGNFSSSAAHIILDHLLDDEDMGGFLYKRNPSSVKDFKIFSTIFCSVNIYSKFETELKKLVEKRKVVVVHEDNKEKKLTIIDFGVQHLYVSHFHKALICGLHKETL